MRETSAQNLWQSVERIQVSLDLDHRTMADMMSLTEKEYLRARSSGSDIKVNCGTSLSQHLGVSLDSLVNNTLDYKALAQHYKGNLNYLPERYAESPLSKRRTVINLLDFIENRFGWESRVRLLNRFQLNESIFKDPDAVINMRLSVDLANYLYQRSENSELLFEMGQNSAKTHRRSGFGTALSSSRSVKEAFEQMFGGLAKTYIENNFEWKMTALTDTKCEIEGAPSSQLKDSLESEYIRCRSVCLVRQGFISSIPLYMGCPPAEVTETACVAQGDDCCKFTVYFFKRPFYVR